MKMSVKKYFKSILILFLIFISVCLFSCNHFLKGSVLKTQIEDKIEYENSRPVKIRISANKNAISFVSGNGDISKRFTDTHEVVFNLNSDRYVFNGWKVVNLDDEKEDCSSNVSIKTTFSENQYTAVITVITNTADLLISPETPLIPMVDKFYPEYYPGGVSSYLPIIIDFTQPVCEEDVANFDNISIQNKAGEDLTNKFEKPYLSEDGLSLTIISDPVELNKLIGDNPVFDIKVALGPNIRCVNPEYGNILEFNTEYRINRIEDLDDPVLNECSIFRKTFDLETETYSLSEIDSLMEYGGQDVSDINPVSIKDQILSHLVGNEVYLNLSGYDETSGIKGFVVSETVVYNDFGSMGAGLPNKQTINCFDITENGNNYSVNNYEYQFLSSESGLFKIDVALIDKSNHESNKKSFWVYRNSSFVREYSGINSTRYNIAVTGLYDWYNFDQNILKSFTPESDMVYPDSEDSPTYTFNKGDLGFVCNGEIYRKYENSCYSTINTNVKFTVTYWNEGDSQETLFGSYKGNQPSYSSPGKKIKFRVDKDSYIKIHAVNDLGQECERLYTIPAAPKHINLYTPFLYSDEDGDHYQGRIYLYGGDKRLYYYVLEKKSSETEYKKLGIYSPYEYSFYGHVDSYYKVYPFYIIQTEKYHYDEETPSNPFLSSIIGCASNLIEFKIGSNLQLESVFSVQIPEGGFTFPSLENVEVKAGENNSGIYNINLDWNFTNRNSEYEYKLYTYNTKYDSNQKVYQDNWEHFSLPCGSVYALGVDIVDSCGVVLDSRRFTKEENLIDTSKLNSPLDMSKVYSFGYQSAYLGPFLYVDIGKNFTDAGRLLLEYWVEPVSFISKSNSISFNEEKIKKLKKYTEEIQYNGSEFRFTEPVFDLAENTLCYVYLRITDENKRYGEKVFMANPYILYPDVEFDYSKIKMYKDGKEKYSFYSGGVTYSHRAIFIPKREGTAVPGIIKSQFFSYYDKTNGSWVLNYDRYSDCCSNEGSRGVHKEGDGYYFYFDDTETSITKSFTRISTMSSNGKEPSLNTTVFPYNPTLYIYPPYFYNKEYESNPLKRKNIMSLKNGDQVFIDREAMVRTVYSVNDWGNNAQMWSSRGIEADVTIKNYDCTYMPAKEKVPAGNYYCTVVNFADGSCAIGDVHFKAGN